MFYGKCSKRSTISIRINRTQYIGHRPVQVDGPSGSRTLVVVILVQAPETIATLFVASEDEIERKRFKVAKQ